MCSLADFRTRRAAAIGKVEGILDRRAFAILSGSRSGISRKNLSSEVSVVFPEPLAPAARVSLGWVTASAKRTAQGPVCENFPQLFSISGHAGAGGLGHLLCDFEPFHSHTQDTPIIASVVGVF